MNKNEDLLSASDVRSALDYSPAHGTFTWICRPTNRIPAGSPAGCVDRRKGYVHIGIKRMKFSAHRLAWLYMTGEWPTQEIDHINGVRSDNRFGNLREVSTAVNGRNRELRKDNKTKLPGISWCSSEHKWRVQISTTNGRIRRRFDDLNDAIAMRDRLYLQNGYTVRHLTGAQP